MTLSPPQHKLRADERHDALDERHTVKVRASRSADEYRACARRAETVIDCAVTMTECNYSAPRSTAADFRKLTPLVLMQALERAGTVVCEPIVRVELEIPSETLGAVLDALARLGAGINDASLKGDLAVVETVLSAARARDLQRQLSGLTRGEGVLESAFEGYEPVRRAADTATDEAEPSTWTTT